MTQLNQNSTLRDLSIYLSANGNEFILEKILASDYKSFVRALYGAIDKATLQLEGNTKHRSEDSEDRTTIEFCTALEMAGYSAKHDIQTGGHVDITVVSGKFSWLGEAKIFNAVTEMRSGYQQLTHRYANGAPDQAAGGMLAYIKRANASKHMATWRKVVENEFKVTTLDCADRPGLAFYSESASPSSGLTYCVRHMAVMLHYAPIV